jgi:hypothetical protein
LRGLSASGGPPLFVRCPSAARDHFAGTEFGTKQVTPRRLSVKGSKVIDANRFVVRLALGVLTERYSHEVIMLSLDNGNC